MERVEVYEVRFWDASTDETKERWLTALGLEVMSRQCKPTGQRKLVVRSEVSNEIWCGRA